MDERMTPAPDALPAAPAAPVERWAGTPRRFARWYRRHVWPATAALIILVFAAGFVTLQLVVRDRIGDGVTVAQRGMSVDVAATAQAALARGRHRLALGLQVWLPGGGGDVTPTVRVNAAAYQQGLEAVRAAVDVAARTASVSYTH